MSLEKICKNPNLKKYNFRVAHPEIFEYPRDLIKLFPEEENYLQKRGFSVIYVLKGNKQKQVPNFRQLKERSRLKPYRIELNPNSKSLMERQPLQLRVNTKVTYCNLYHPSEDSIKKLINRLECQVLETSEYLNNQTGPIDVVVFDNGWMGTINSLKSKYEKVREYRMKR